MRFKQKTNFLWALPWLIATIIVVSISFGSALIHSYTTGSDGYDYAIMGIHLLHGIGSYWSPEFTTTRFIHFYEHPPMGIWYFALYFKLFGVHWYVDKIIAIVNTTWTVAIVYCFWRREFPYVSRWLAWIPIILLFTNLYLSFFLAGNKLECIEIPLSMTLFYWLTAVRYKQVALSKLYIQAIFAGAVCVIGFEINGLLFLYVWAAFILCRLSSKNFTWSQALLLTVVLVASSLIFYGLLMGLVPAARYNNWMYWSTQLKPALLGKRSDSGYVYTGIRHFAPLITYLYFIAYQVIATIILWLALEWYGIKHFFKPLHAGIKHHHHLILFYTLLCLITSLSLLVSAKDLSYYNLHTNTYLALLLSCIITPMAHQWLEQAPLKARVYLFWILIACCAPILNTLQVYRIRLLAKHSVSGQVHYSFNVLKKIIPPHSTISMPPELLTHSLTYLEPDLARFLDSGLLGGYDCKYLITSIYDLTPVPKAYHYVPSSLIELALYERPHALPSCRARKESMKEYHNYGQPPYFLL